MNALFKRLLVALALAIWTSTSFAHHIAGIVACTDTSPSTRLQGVTVTLTGTLNTLTAVTASDGGYFVSLPTVTDTYTVTITPPPGMTIVSPAGGQHVLTIFLNGIGGPDHYDNADFNLTGCEAPPLLGRIGDTVYCDTNGNGVQNAGEPGIPGVKVNLVCRNAAGAIVASAMATTDASGKYLFVNVPAGACEVTVDTTTVPPPCNIAVCATRVLKTLAAGEIYLDADFCFTQTPPTLGRIGDTVYCDANGNGTQDAGEAGIPGVKVNLVCRNAAGAVVATAMATTDANGKYLFVDVPAGTCEVTVDISTVPAPCNSPVCATRVVEVLGAGEIFLDADFCFTEPSGPGTGTPGYWKNHPDAWPVDSITIGGITYTKEAAIKWMSTAEKGDKTLTVFRHLVSAKLNVLIGNTSACIDADIAAADAWMTAHPVGSKVGGKTAAWAEISGVAGRLDDYNNGRLCAPHRD